MAFTKIIPHITQLEADVFPHITVPVNMFEEKRFNSVANR